MLNLAELKICFLAGTLGRGGAERQLIHMLRALAVIGIETRVLCLTKDEPLEKEIRAMGIPITWVGSSRWRMLRLWQIIRELRREPADIVQSAHFYTNLYAAVAARAARMKAIGAIRSNLSSAFEYNGVMAWGQLHLPQHLITNSTLARQRAIAKGIKADYVHFISNVVDVNRVEILTNRNGHGKRLTRILFAARLSAEKRPDRFLKVLRKIVQRRPDLDFRASIIGDGPLRQDLERLSDSLGLRPKYVEFLGELDDLSDAYNNSDLFVLTSELEGTPNVLLEAMGHGIPVIATNVGGVSALVRHGENGFLVDTGEDSIANSILTLIDNPSLGKKMGSSGQRFVIEEHSPARLAENLLTVYQRVVDEQAVLQACPYGLRDGRLQ
jgi:glycosyltransferase involved in cell wall biosynthesis